MANKINQITIGDMLLLQLDVNPATDGIGYDAPVGSQAYIDNGQSFVKLSGLNTNWIETVIPNKREIVVKLTDVTFTGPLEVPTLSMINERGTLMLSKVIVIIMKKSTGHVSHRGKTFTMKLEDAINHIWSTPFNSDGDEFYEDETEQFNFSINFQNDPTASISPTTNTFINIVSISDLVINEEYDILVIQERLSNV